MYGCESWTVKKAQRRRIDAFELWCWRRVLRVPWTVAHQAPLSLGFSRQEYCSGLPVPPLGDLPDSGIKPESSETPALPVGSLPLSHPISKNRKARNWLLGGFLLYLINICWSLIFIWCKFDNTTDPLPPSSIDLLEKLYSYLSGLL